MIPYQVARPLMMFGVSLSCNIVVKEHGGMIEIASRPSEFTAATVASQSAAR